MSEKTRFSDVSDPFMVKKTSTIKQISTPEPPRVGAVCEGHLTPAKLVDRVNPVLGLKSEADARYVANFQATFELSHRFGKTRNFQGYLMAFPAPQVGQPVCFARPATGKIS